MEDPTLKAGVAATVLRACERGRLEKQFMSDAYEQLVPIVKRRCGELRGDVVDNWPVTPEQQGGDQHQACGIGG